MAPEVWGPSSFAFCCPANVVLVVVVIVIIIIIVVVVADIDVRGGGAADAGAADAGDGSAVGGGGGGGGGNGGDSGSHGEIRRRKAGRRVSRSAEGRVFGLVRLLLVGAMGLQLY